MSHSYKSVVFIAALAACGGEDLHSGFQRAQLSAGAPVSKLDVLQQVITDEHLAAEGQTLSRTEIEFGRVALRGDMTQALSIRNVQNPADSAEELVVTIVGIDGVDSADFRFEGASEGVLYELAPGTQLDLDVVFEPDAAGPRNAVLVIEQCKGGCRTEVPLSGFGTPEAFSCDASHVYFPSAPVGQCEARGFDCSNQTSYPLEISSFELVGLSSDFTVKTSASLPHELLGGETVAFKVVLCADDVLDDDGALELTVVSSHAGKELVTIPVGGHAR